ncbi:MAG: HK97 family phage prohead protease [Firmicutes bacterium]|nr:HK97 family phage prohead protease [Bacillota bacterium]
MKLTIRSDNVTIEGYVNAVERNSKPLMSRIGQFLERICKGAFGRAIERNKDIHVLLNHDWNKDLGSTAKGNLELREDPIGLYAVTTVTDKETVEAAKRGDLVGWSFGFRDLDVETREEDGLPLRVVRDLDLQEVSILDRRKIPAYDGTLITVRAEGEDPICHGEALVEEITRADETPIDYSCAEQLIAQMKGAAK